MIRKSFTNIIFENSLNVNFQYNSMADTTLTSNIWLLLFNDRHESSVASMHWCGMIITIGQALQTLYQAKKMMPICGKELFVCRIQGYGQSDKTISQLWGL